MHTAVRLNESIRSKSSGAALVIVNFPQPPKKTEAAENCILYAQAQPCKILLKTDNMKSVLSVSTNIQNSMNFYVIPCMVYVRVAL